MSIPRKHTKESFEPKIGFDQCDKELSFSFSELDLQGHTPKLESFFSDDEKEVPETPKSLNEESESGAKGNVSLGLNHAFFEENSDSASIGRPVKIGKEIGMEGVDEEWTGGAVAKVRRAESENSEINEIILSNTEVQIRLEEEEGKAKRRNKHGDRVMKGSAGTQGSQGTQGTQGTKGTKGTQGINGIKANRQGEGDKDQDKGHKDEHLGRKKKNCCRCASCYIF